MSLDLSLVVSILLPQRARQSEKTEKTRKYSLEENEEAAGQHKFSIRTGYMGDHLLVIQHIRPA